MFKVDFGSDIQCVNARKMFVFAHGVYYFNFYLYSLKSGVEVLIKQMK